MEAPQVDGSDVGVSEALDRIAALEAEQAGLIAAASDARDAIIDPLMASIKSKLDDVDSTFSPRIVELQAKILSERDNVRNSVLVLGRSVEGATLRCEYVRGRVTWDDRALSGYEAAHPEIANFKRVGNANTRIVAIRRGG